MASNPEAAVREHAAAWSAKDLTQIAATATYPLFQGFPDGRKAWLVSAVDETVADLRHSRLGIEQLDPLATSGELVLFRLAVQGYDEDDAPLGPSGVALWAVHHVGDEWKVGWRQFLGVG